MKKPNLIDLIKMKPDNLVSARGRQMTTRTIGSGLMTQDHRELHDENGEDKEGNSMDDIVLKTLHEENINDLSNAG